MRHLKRFNESDFSAEDLKDLRYFCETCLAYLIDEDFSISVTYSVRKDRARIYFFKKDLNFPIPFNWNDIKDHYIPFYQMLSKKYNIGNTNSRMKDGEFEEVNCSVKFEYRKPAKNLWETPAKWFTEEEILNDNIEDGSHIGVITIFLNNI